MKNLPATVICTAVVASLFHLACSSQEQRPQQGPQLPAKPTAAKKSPAIVLQGPFAEGLARAEENSRWGFVDQQNEWVIPPRFDWAETFAEGLAAVRLDERWGYIDPAGKTVVDFRYADADHFAEGLGAVKDERGWRYLDAKGTVQIYGPFAAARPFRCGQAWVKLKTSYLLGDEPHGEYQHLCRGEGRHIQALDDVARVEQEEKRERAVSAMRSHIDAYALELLFRREEEKETSELDYGLQSTHGLRLESQWEEQVWRLIDTQGHVIPRTEEKTCATADATRDRAMLVSEVSTLSAAQRQELAAKVGKLDTLRDRSEFFRQMVVAGQHAVPVLLELISNKDLQIRLNTLEVLVRLGPEAVAAFPALVKLLDDPSDEVFFYTVWALGRMRHRAAEAVQALITRHPRNRPLVTAAVLDIGTAGVPRILQMIDSAERKTKLFCVNLLEQMGPPAIAAAPTLQKYLPDKELATDVALAIAAIGPRDGQLRSVVDDTLVAAIRDKAYRRRAEAAGAITDDAFNVEKNQATFFAALKDKDRLVRSRIAAGLLRSGDQRGLDGLLGLHETTFLREPFLQLERLGTRANAAIPRVQYLLDHAFSRAVKREADDGDDGDSFCEHYEQALSTFLAIGAEVQKVLPYFAQELRPNSQDGEWTAFINEHKCDAPALALLKKLGPRAAPAVPLLLRYLAYEVPASGEAVFAVLNAIGEAALPPLVERLRQGKLTMSIQTVIFDMLEAYPSQASDALPALQQLAERDRSSDISERAVAVANKIIRNASVRQRR